jgi:hypothetical protein
LYEQDYVNFALEIMFKTKSLAKNYKWRNLGMFSKKLMLSLLSTAVLLGSSAYASSGCKGCDIAGSFVAARVSQSSGDPIMDQIILHEDGTVYFNQSTALVTPITTDTFAPDIAAGLSMIAVA